MYKAKDKLLCWFLGGKQMEHFKRILFLSWNYSTAYFWDYNFLWNIDRCCKFWWFAIGHSVSDGYKSSSRKQYLRYYPWTCFFIHRAQFIYEISPLIYVFFPIPIMGKHTIANPHIFYSHFLNRCLLENFSISLQCWKVPLIFPINFPH